MGSSPSWLACPRGVPAAGDAPGGLRRREGGSGRSLFAASTALQDNAVPFVFISGVPISSSAVLGLFIVLMCTAVGSCPCFLSSLVNTVDQEASCLILYCMHCTCPIRKGLNLAETCETHFNSNVSSAAGMLLNQPLLEGQAIPLPFLFVYFN